ncbi:OmpA family protein [Phaeobacter marinintestinus]|uniref:OmpA family protein n=1 Tax=Falsiphaeobacter marinintestinus TaxID=1492905 RepID=UPI0011B6D338|nr:OmpA family protein [Phaeobacter marinintestinus]
MRLSFVFAVGMTFLLAAGLSLVAARFAATAVEEASEIDVRLSLDRAAHGWAEVQANGLQVILSGIAPDEATRFNALTVVGDVVDAARIIDGMEIAPTADLAPPKFSIEILRNDSGISIIGLIPASTDRADLVDQLHGLVGEDQVADLLQTADYPVPAGWDDALQFSVIALSKLPRSKISVTAGQVSVDAISDSPEAKMRLETALTRAAPPGLRLALDIAAPRPVITPFTLRFLIDEAGGRFDACSADTAEAGARILAAARAAGAVGDVDCTVGMGVPSPNWAQATVQGIQALAELGAGAITYSDADITLVAAEGTSENLFDRVVGELDAALPDVFALHAVLPVPESDTSAGPPEFTGTLSPEGLVQLRGRISDPQIRDVVDSFARARFGTKEVYTATRVASDLPADWAMRVLAGVEVLSKLRQGVVTVTPDDLVLRGVSHQKDASAEIARLLSDKLGEAEKFALEITYQEPPEDPDEPIDPQQCIARIKEIQETSKIAFEPGSATITEASLGTMNGIVDVLKACGSIRLEIQGHTDSQGREEMNQQLSQARAQSVLNELRARRVPTASYVAVGYGETRPISPNDTEDGREDNRRIEFWLIKPRESLPEEESPLEELAGQTEVAPSEDAADDDTSEADAPDTQPETDGENN